MSIGRQIDYLFITVIIPVLAQRNLSPDGTPLQSSTYSTYGPHNALNGPASTKWSSGCSHTADNMQDAWWKLQFKDLLFMTKVLIYYRDDFPERVNGFSLYVSNSTEGNIPISGPEGYLCYKDPDTLVNQSVIFDIDCYAIGRSIIIYNNTTNGEAYVELCYVEVRGCQLKTHGIACNESCPSKCLGNHCFPENGSCLWACGSGFCLKDNCDVDDVCTDGCTQGRSGKYCDKSYKNLALDMPAIQGPDYITNASYIVDGSRLTSSCAVLNGSNTWFQIDLGDLSIVWAIYLHFNDSSINESSKYSIYCTNATEKNWLLLYEGEKPTNDTTIQMNQICRYVRYMPPPDNKRICELEVIGCNRGWYGIYCNKVCPHNCDGSCDLNTGNCINGCKDGFTGIRCNTVCQDGKFGSQCSQSCSENCYYYPCDHVTGECVNGTCEDGWTGYNCTTECRPGTYGRNCSESCSIGCINGTCYHVDGNCTIPEKCKYGWKIGPKCEETCDDYYYGENCVERCYCLSRPCNKSTGKCQGVCQKGWKGESCTEECTKGHFGETCASSCDGCIFGECDRFDGICTNATHCKPGWLYEKKCNTKCGHGKYGNNCSRSCAGCVNEHCDHVDGFCTTTNECKLGWKVGLKCNEKCRHGTYGRNCSELCSGCLNEHCDHVEGFCNTTNDCKPGWNVGPKCNDQCNHGRFGKNCSEKCNGCVDELCDPLDGLCNNNSACKPGWKVGPKCLECSSGIYGESCSKSCSGCVNALCDRTEGLCNITKECKPGWKLGPKCNESCADGEFGHNCNGYCGTCVNHICDKITGTCARGCITGYYGSLCTSLVDKSQLEENSYVSGIIGGVIGAVITLVFVAISFVLIRRRNTRKDRNKETKVAVTNSVFKYTELMDKNESQATSNDNDTGNEYHFYDLSKQTTDTTYNQAENVISRDQLNSNTYEDIALKQ